MYKLILTGLIALTPMIAFADTSTGTQTPPPPRPPMGSGSEMSPELKGIHIAMGQLSATDRATLITMIREFLISKGVDPAKFAEKREEIQAIREETRDAIQEAKKNSQEGIKEARKSTQQMIQNKKAEMRTKVKNVRQN